MEQMEKDKENLSKLLYSTISQPNQTQPDNHHNLDQNQNPDEVQIVLPFHPAITAEYIVRNYGAMHANFRVPMHFNGFMAYRDAYAQQAQAQGIPNLPSLELSRLWANEPPHVKSEYCNIAEQVKNHYNQRNSLFINSPNGRQG